MTDKILEVRGLTKTYGGVKKKGAKQPTPTLDVLKGIDIDIYRGDVVCLIGPSGCGKSTFLRCLNRLEIPTGGSIKFEGIEVDDAHIDAVRQKMGMVFQHFNLFPHLTVKQNLCLAPELLKLKSKEEDDRRQEEKKPKRERADYRNETHRKMTYKEKMEFERLEKEMGELEQEREQLEAALCSGTLSIDELTEKSKRLPEVKELIDEKEMRWLELSEIGG